MSERSDGGPAFPTSLKDDEGMSLRDYFAGQALSALDRTWGLDTISAPDAAAASYRIADEMLKARVA